MLLFLREGVVSVCAVALELPGILLESVKFIMIGERRVSIVRKAE